MIHGQPTLALAEEGSFTTESEWGPCPESTDSFRNLTAFLCLDCDLRKARNMVRFGLVCTGVANTLLTFQDEARIYILFLNLFLGKENNQ